MNDLSEISDLDRLFDIHSRLCIEYTKELSDEYNALKAKIEGKIEKAEFNKDFESYMKWCHGFEDLESQVAKLKEEYLELDKQCAIERETANGLDYTCENYEKQIIKLKEENKELEDELLYWADVSKSLKKSLEDEVMTKLKAWDEIKQLKSTLDEIKELVRERRRNGEIELAEIFETILAKHEDKNESQV